MFWRTLLRTLFATQPEQSRHLGVLVCGTLWHAESAVLQLKMQGLGDGMTGVASVFGVPGGLEAQTGEGHWISLSTLSGRWILIIPEDAYARYRPQFDGVIGGTPLDGRVQSTGAIRTISQDAEERLRALVARMPPLSSVAGDVSSPQTGTPL